MKPFNQLLAERAEEERLNIIQRPSLFPQLEPMAMDLIIAEEKKREQIHQVNEWSWRQWDYVRQIQAEVRGWRQKHAKMMLTVDKLIEEEKDGF